MRRPSRNACARAVAVALAASATACGSSGDAGDGADHRLREIVTQGIASVERTHDPDALHARLRLTIRRLRALPETGVSDRRTKTLALRGFEETLRGVESRLSLARNDSGKLEAAVRDAIRADRALKSGARDLRAAGRALGIRVGDLNGY